MLVRWMPEDSALYASFRGGPQWRPWSSLAEVMAGLWDLQYAKATAGSKKAKKQTYPRPGAKKKRRGSEADIFDKLNPALAAQLRKQAADRAAQTGG